MADQPSDFGARLQGWAMIAVLAVGFGLGLRALTLPASLQRLSEVANRDAFLSGRTAAEVNHIMAHDLPIGRTLLAAGGVLRWRLFGSGGPQVTVGCDDWLYLTEELRPWPDSDASMRTRAEALYRIAAKLQTNGIALQLVLVPDKARIETENRRHRRQIDEILNQPRSEDDVSTVMVYGPPPIATKSLEVGCGVRYSEQSVDRLAAFAGLLKGLSVVDLNPVFAAAPTQIYYRTDTHWNQAGAALAARTVAASTRAPVARDASFRTDAAPVADRAGDLLRLMSLETVPDLALKLRPLPDREAPETTVQVDAPATGGLLDDAPVPEIVLLGSSYSVNANFHGRLQEAMHAPIGQFAQAGGAFWGSARDYFRSLAFRETPPKLVIWEIPERVVNQPVGADEAAFLKDWSAIRQTLSASP